MYKDKDKQREANRQAKQKQRQGMTKGMTSEGMTQSKTDIRVIPKHKGPTLSDPEFIRLLATVPPGTPNHRVSKPGDDDYVPQCETTKDYTPTLSGSASICDVEHEDADNG